MQPIYKRVLLKLSGEALAGDQRKEIRFVCLAARPGQHHVEMLVDAAADQQLADGSGNAGLVKGRFGAGR